MKTGKLVLKIMTGLFIIFQLTSCESNNNEIYKLDFEESIKSKRWIGDSIPDAYSTKEEWTDSNGILHWKLEYHKSPVLLQFGDEKAILEVPKIEGVFNLADIVHQHGTSLAGQEPKFEYNYEINESDSTIILRGGFLDEIELKFQKGKLKWPLWKSNEFMVFKERE